MGSPYFWPFTYKTQGSNTVIGINTSGVDPKIYGWLNINLDM